MKYPSDKLGRLVQPRHYDSLQATVAHERVWAADNDCFQGLDAAAYRRMVTTIPTDGCKFVTVPDVVGNHRVTLRRWWRWAPFVKRAGFPAAFVIQNGCDTYRQVPADADAVFVGGDTVYKLSARVEAIVRAAKADGRWVHMGRVNSTRRIQYAQAIGCDSVDGSSFSMFSDTYMPRALAILESRAEPQMFDFGGAA